MLKLLQLKKLIKLVNAYNKGKLQPRPGRSVEETLEVEVMGVLGRVRDKSGEIAGWHLGMDNFAVIMARSGARGSMLNLSQMAASIGQQAVRGERISRGYERRTLSHFNKGDLGADAKDLLDPLTKVDYLQLNISSTPWEEERGWSILRLEHQGLDTCRGV